MESNQDLKIAHERDKILNDYITDWFNDLADWFEAERQIRQAIGDKGLKID